MAFHPQNDVLGLGAGFENTKQDEQSTSNYHLITPLETWMGFKDSLFSSRPFLMHDLWVLHALMQTTALFRSEGNVIAITPSGIPGEEVL